MKQKGKSKVKIKLQVFCIQGLNQVCMKLFGKDFQPMPTYWGLVPVKQEFHFPGSKRSYSNKMNPVEIKMFFNLNNKKEL